MRPDLGGSSRLTVSVRSVAALHDVGGLHRYRLVAEVLDLERINVAGLAHLHLPSRKASSSVSGTGPFCDGRWMK